MPLPLYKRLTYTPAVTKWLTYTLHLTEVKKLVLNLYLLLLIFLKKLYIIKKKECVKKKIIIYLDEK